MQISNNIDQKDIESLQMKVRSLDCPVIFDVTLKNKESFCVDSSQPWFRVVLEILETDASWALNLIFWYPFDPVGEGLQGGENRGVVWRSEGDDSMQFNCKPFVFLHV